MRQSMVMLAVIAALTVSVCSSDEGGTDGVLEGDQVTVDMFDNRYEYTEIRIPVGGSVNWLGAGRNPHNSVAADGSWSTADVFGSLEQHDRDEAVIAYDQAGEYPFYCTFHGNDQGAGMAGLLIVGNG